MATVAAAATAEQKVIGKERRGIGRLHSQGVAVVSRTEPFR